MALGGAEFIQSFTPAREKNCICTGIFYRYATLDEIPANVQVILKRKPEIGLMEIKTCAFASFLLRWIEIGEIRCIFAGIAAKTTLAKISSPFGTPPQLRFPTPVTPPARIRLHPTVVCDSAHASVI
ncbi:hypothetical protein [Cohnella sp. GCM10012308]|uniref:hypothetical protein n=1 Tax=Cohnella sp. GCM10012308 TaxID=3317329 RepID=UPI003615A821